MQRFAVFFLILIALALLFSGCPGTQSRIIDHTAQQGQAVIFTPEQTQKIIELAGAQLQVGDNDTCTIAGAKTRQGKLTMVWRCEP